jgi:alpha-beta hydrolase superfamily lysophospholipase
MPVFDEFFFISSTGVNRIHVKTCTPDGGVRGVVMIEHGIAEHVERYAPFMSFLAENGFAVAADDHLGHGASIERDDDKGFFAESDGWWRVIDDIKTLRDTMKEKYPGVPFVLFGHSMGSFLARTYIIKYPNDFDAAVISGTGQQSPLMVNAGYLMANMLVNKLGARGDGRQLNDIAFGSYNKKIADKRTDFDWLSRDPEQVQKYIDDPLCGFVAKCSLYRDMMAGIKFISDKKNAAGMNKDMPVYFMSGAEDPVGEYGKGVNKAYKMFCDLGMKDVTIRLYPGGRHEMLNETNAADVRMDILNWINEKI